MSDIPHEEGLVLVAEDDTATRLILEARLRLEGYSTIGARHGMKALAKMRTHLPEFALLDWRMSGVDGAAVLKEMARDENIADIPVIILSGQNDLETRLEALRLGALDFIVKMPSEEELVLKIHNHQRMRRKHVRVQTEVEIDALTQVGNRRRFERAWTAMTNRLAQGDALSLLMVDIDHFKLINDNYGHPAGDTALIQIARVLAAAVRARDVVCRFGGEEFAILLPSVAAEGALRIAERIRNDLAGLNLPSGPLTASIGIATNATTTLNAMQAAADNALYQAKHSGRDQVVLFENPSSKLAAS